MKNYSSVLIIYNPNAMKGKIDEFIPKIKERLLLRYSQVDTVFSPEIDGAETLALKLAPKYDIVVSCGGDGTLHQVVNGVMKSNSNPLIGILPFGTCNDVARTLKIPFDVDRAIDCILRLNTQNYDLMYDGQDYITYSIATGYLIKSTYSATNESKKKLGRFAYFLAALKCVFKLDSLPITINCDGERFHNKFAYLMAINGESAGGFKLNKNENLNNGKVKLVMIKRGNSIANFVTFLKLFFFGIKAIRKNKSVIIREVENFQIENHANAPFILDGERVKFLKKDICVKSHLTFIKK